MYMAVRVVLLFCVYGSKGGIAVFVYMAVRMVLLFLCIWQ